MNKQRTDAKLRIVERARAPHQSPPKGETFCGKPIEELNSAEYTAYLASGLGG